VSTQDGLIERANAEIDQARRYPPTPERLREWADNHRRRGRVASAAALEEWAARLEQAGPDPPTAA